MFGVGVTIRYVADSSFGAFATAAAGRRPRPATTATTRKSERMLIVSPLSSARISRAFDPAVGRILVLGRRRQIFIDAVRRRARYQSFAPRARRGPTRISLR